MDNNNKMPPKVLIKTLLFLIKQDEIPAEVKQEKTDSLISIFGSVEKAKQYIVETA